MGYEHIDNLYNNKEILMFNQCYALEKIHGTCAHVYFNGKRMVNYSAGGDEHDEFISIFDTDKLKKKFIELFENKKVTIYGENHGNKQQRMNETYGKKTRFVVFDVKIDDCFLNVPNAEDVVNKLGLEFVGYKLINTDLESIDAERDRESVQARRNGIKESKIREGVVLRPLIELTKNNGDRIMCKHKRNEFRETKTPRIVSDEELKVLTDAKMIAEEWVTVERLRHVLDKLKCDVSMNNTPQIIRAMIEDVYREAKDEIVQSVATRKAIGKKTAKMLRLHLESLLYE